MKMSSENSYIYIDEWTHSFTRESAHSSGTMSLAVLCYITNIIIIDAFIQVEFLSLLNIELILTIWSVSFKRR